MGILWSILGFIALIIWIITIVDVVRQHLPAGKAAAWILLVLILPFIGAIIYWVLRKPTQDEAEAAYTAERSVREGGPRMGL
jgi:hypothetical protein